MSVVFNSEVILRSPVTLMTEGVNGEFSVVNLNKVILTNDSVLVNVSPGAAMDHIANNVFGMPHDGRVISIDKFSDDDLRTISAAIEIIKSKIVELV